MDINMSVEEERDQKAERMHRIRDEELKKAIEDLGDKLSKRMYAIEAKVDPMYEMFSSVSGFNRIGIWILKFLAIIGAALAGLYALISLFKQLGRP